MPPLLATYSEPAKSTMLSIISCEPLVLAGCPSAPTAGRFTPEGLTRSVPSAAV